MNNKKVCFISCVNNDRQYEECLIYLNNLNVPEGYDVEIISIKESTSMAAGYNEAMNYSDAKYKVYLHQDTFIINRNFIYDILETFNLDDNVGMLGVVGAKTIPINCAWWESTQKYGQVYINDEIEMKNLKFNNFENNFEEVKCVDGLIMVTQYDITWREDLFDGWNFYDISQSLEFKRSGYKVIVPKQETSWIIYDCELVKTQNVFEKYKSKFIDEYSKDIFPLVSILIPTYNRPEYLKEALLSVINQSYKNIEIIIGDDSTNNETEILIKEQFINKYENIKYYHNDENLGQFDNDIKLYNIANGEFINYLMDDDLFETTKIEKMMNYFNQDINEEISIVTSHRKLIDFNGNIGNVFGNTNDIFIKDTLINGIELGNFILKYNYNCIGEPTTVLFRRNKLKEPFGIYNNRKYGCNVDQATWFNLLSNGNAVFINETLSYFRIHDNQQLSSDKMKLLGALDYMHEVLTGREKGFLVKDEDFKIALSSSLEYSQKIINYFNNLEGKEQYKEEFVEFEVYYKKIRDQLDNNIINQNDIYSSNFKNNPLVSILIPTYNQTKYLKEALESALNQTYSNIEIIIGDDSTTSEVEDFLKIYLEKYNNITYFKNEREGMDYGYKNVNELLKRSKGEYINYLNHDDVFHPQKIEKMVNCFLENPNVMLVTSVRQPIDEKGNELKLSGAFERLFDKDTIISGYEMSRFAISNLVNCIGEPTTVLFKKGYIEEGKYGYLNNERIKSVSDLSNWINILQYGDLAYISDELSYFRIHPKQNSNKTSILIQSAIGWLDLVKNSYELKLFNRYEYKLILNKCFRIILIPILDKYLFRNEDVEERFKKEIIGSYNDAMQIIMYDKSEVLYECPVCNNKVESFLPYQYKNHKSNFTSSYDIIGSDTENFSCPICYSHDRERHLFKFFEKLDIWNNYIVNKSILHIAPERYIQKMISNLNTKRYICGDLYPSNNSIVKVDITNIKYKNQEFDFIICNHVLEHIPNDIKAMKELYRVLKNGGYALLQTPYSILIDKSFEEENINTDELRRKFYGQKDHVRVYGVDFFERLKSVGFSLEIIKNNELFSVEESRKYGFNYKEDLILVKK